MIMVDDRIGSKDLVTLLPPDLCKRMRLDAGDAAFWGYGPEGPLTLPVGIELKNVADAISCMKSGRLVGEQMPKLSQVYKRVYLIIEGQFRASPKGTLESFSWYKGQPTWSSIGSSTISYHMFDSWINTLAEIGRIVVKRSLDRKETAAQVLGLYRWWTKDYSEHRSLMAFDSSQEPLLLTKPSVKRKVAACLPGIGWSKSENVASHFQSITDMANAGEAEWLKIDGVGKTLAKKIVAALKT